MLKITLGTETTVNKNPSTSQKAGYKCCGCSALDLLSVQKKERKPTALLQEAAVSLNPKKISVPDSPSNRAFAGSNHGTRNRYTQHTKAVVTHPFGYSVTKTEKSLAILQSILSCKMANV